MCVVVCVRTVKPYRTSLLPCLLKSLCNSTIWGRLVDAEPLNPSMRSDGTTTLSVNKRKRQDVVNMAQGLANVNQQGSSDHHSSTEVDSSSSKAASSTGTTSASSAVFQKLPREFSKVAVHINFLFHCMLCTIANAILGRIAGWLVGGHGI